jgi:membrane dipeptidase
MNQTQAKWPVFDGHCDSLQDYFLDGRDVEDFFNGSDIAHLDYPRANAGGMVGELFAIFCPPPNGRRPKSRKGEKSPKPTYKDFVTWQSTIEPEYAMKVAENGIASYNALEKASGGKFKIVRGGKDLPSPELSECLHAVIHFEGAEPIAADLSNLESFYAQGLRTMGLVWSRPNAFGHGVSLQFEDDKTKDPGLTPAGKELIGACNDLGILLDVSHLNTAGFEDVEKLVPGPFVASHSCVYELCNSPRNLSDWQLDAIAAHGGLVGINFAVGFLRGDGEMDADTSLEEMARHFSYIAERIGVEHLALGSDFDGALIPNEIGGAEGLPKLMNALEKAGFSPEELLKIACANWLRVLRDAWKD